MFWPERDANPFLHFFESLWMLAGRSDVRFIADIVKRMASFSDDGVTLHGAYGKRWRSWFQTEGGALDQVETCIHLLRKNPDDRRCVIQMWDASADLGRQGKDVPCNTQCYVWVAPDGRVELSILCRSNDMIWGAYGANAVHFSYLLEYIASSLGRPVGRMYQYSNNMHAYVDTLSKVAELGSAAYTPDAYGLEEVAPYPMMQTEPHIWRQDLDIFLKEGPIVGFRDPFFRRVVTPMWSAFRHYKTNEGLARYTVAVEILGQCKASDWRKAATEWLVRRATAFASRPSGEVKYDRA